MADRVLRENVRVEAVGRDSHGTLIGRVWLDGKSINLWMVESGWAWHFRNHSKSKTLAKAEQQAREQKLGLWQADNPVAPWQWRKVQAEKRSEAALAKTF